jgi:two-component system KDP operon response regulator KdpE
MSLTARILVAEDEAHLQDFICRNLRARGFTVFEAASGLEAMAIWESEQPDLLILDLMMPHMDGLEVCRRVREVSTTPIFVVTALDADSDKVAALDLGADDYITKPFSIEELLARVRATLRRTRWQTQTSPVASGMRRFGSLEIDLEGRVVRRDGQEVRLSPTEFALLAELVTNAGKVLPHRLLLERVWGHGYGEESDYLRVYLTRLRRKLEANPAKPRFLVTAPGVGYRFVPPE